jgi:hypothetical protein
MLDGNGLPAVALGHTFEGFFHPFLLFSDSLEKYILSSLD